MRRRLVVPLAALVAAAALAGTLTGCASDDTETGIRIVASTNVYGDLAATVGGDLVTVDSIIADPVRDPHEYEADARSQLALSKAALVVRNGGGYDDFVDTMLTASGNEDVPVIDAVELSGFDTTASDFNEHVWYDYPTVSKVVRQLVAELSAIDPDHGQQYTDNAAPLLAGLDSLDDQVAGLAEQWGGTSVAITEAVPLHLVLNLGLENRTPTAFSDAVENDTDAPPTAVRTTVELLTARTVAVLIYNPQTGGSLTDAVLAAADKAGVPAVAAPELIPTGYHYLEWQSALLDALAGALGS